MADKQSSHAHHAASATAHPKKPSHGTGVATATTKSALQQAPSASAIPSSMSPIFVVPSNAPIISDPYFGRPHAPTDTATSVSAAAEPSNVGSIVGGVIGGTAGLVALAVAALVFVRRRKRRRHGDESRALQHHYIRETENNDRSGNNGKTPTVRPPPAYRAHSQKRLTADTLVDQRASMSTMHSNYSSRNQQYTPQLAYKQQQEEDYYSADLLGVSPTHTLIDAMAIPMEDEKGRRQRVPSYQPQVIAMAEAAEEGANNSTDSFYDYLYQNSYKDEDVRPKREGDHRSA